MQKVNPSSFDSNEDKLQVIRSIIKENNLRFPITELASKTGQEKGNVSAMLKGKKPISKNFFRKVLEVFSYNGSSVNTADAGHISEIVVLRQRVKELEEDKKFLQSIINSRLLIGSSLS